MSAEITDMTELAFEGSTVPLTTDAGGRVAGS